MSCYFFCNPIFSSVTFFLALIIISIGVIGLFSKSLAVASLGSFIFFVDIAVETNITLFTNALYVIMAIVLFLMGLKIWGYATGTAEGGEL